MVAHVILGMVMEGSIPTEGVLCKSGDEGVGNHPTLKSTPSSVLQVTKKATELPTPLLLATTLGRSMVPSRQSFSRGKLPSRRCYSPRIIPATSLVVENAGKCKRMQLCGLYGRRNRPAVALAVLLDKPPIVAEKVFV